MRSRLYDVYIHRHEVAKQMTEFRFIDYCPLVFQKLRAFDNISPSDYMVSHSQFFHPQLTACGCQASIKPESFLQSLDNQKFSEGRSGSFFCFSPDKCFIIKTIPPNEASLLREILPRYYQVPPALLPFLNLSSLSSFLLFSLFLPPSSLSPSPSPPSPLPPSPSSPPTCTPLLFSPLIWFKILGPCSFSLLNISTCPEKQKAPYLWGFMASMLFKCNFPISSMLSWWGMGSTRKTKYMKNTI